MIQEIDTCKRLREKYRNTEIIEFKQKMAKTTNTQKLMICESR